MEEWYVVEAEKMNPKLIVLFIFQKSMHFDSFVASLQFYCIDSITIYWISRNSAENLMRQMPSLP